MKKNTRAAISFKALKIETKIATFWFGMESWRTRRRRAVENSLKEQQNVHGPGLRDNARKDVCEEGKWQWVGEYEFSDQGFKVPFDFFSSPTSFLLPPILIPRPNVVTRILYHHASDNLNNTKTPEVYLCYGKSCVSTKKTRREID